MKHTIQVPVSALAIGAYGMPVSADEPEPEPINPEPKDPVRFDVEGIVSSVSGDMATVEVRLINGRRPTPKKSEADEEAELMAAAAEVDADLTDAEED